MVNPALWSYLGDPNHEWQHIKQVYRIVGSLKKFVISRSVADLEWSNSNTEFYGSFVMILRLLWQHTLDPWSSEPLASRSG